MEGPTVCCSHWRRPWHVKWRSTRGWYLENTDGRLVAFGFDSLWDALGWAVGK